MMRTAWLVLWLSACGGASPGADLAAPDLSLGDAPSSCVPYPDQSDAAVMLLPCGAWLCQAGTWCDLSGAQPVCRCGNMPQTSTSGPCVCVRADPADTCGRYWGECG